MWGAGKGGAFFNTINDAVASPSVQPGSVIDVCPGTYAQQVVINKALTIQGIFSGDSSQAVITVPGGGLTTTSSVNSILVTVAAQVEVTAGPVNISNITVDGTARTATCPSTYEVGIFYSSGSSGTVNEIETHNQNCGSYNGIGIAAENGAAASPQSVTIENSNIHDNSFIGITTCSDQTPSTLTASIKGNYITGSAYGVLTHCNAGGSVSGNFITIPASGYVPVYVGSHSATVSGNTVIGGSFGIEVEAAAVVSGNTVSNATSAGIYVDATGSLTSNHIVNNPYGILLGVSGATIKSNAITKKPVSESSFSASRA